MVSNQQLRHQEVETVSIYRAGARLKTLPPKKTNPGSRADRTGVRIQREDYEPSTEAVPVRSDPVPS